jgi:hypothetical protein
MNVSIRTQTRDALGLLALTFMAAASVRADDFATVFSLDQRPQPVTNLDRASPMSDGLRAILALYTFEAGAGCTTYTRDHKDLQCALTRGLALGAQCSPAHINLVASWFKNGMPAFGWLTDTDLQHARQTNELGARCYQQPDGATFQSTWEHIGVQVRGQRITVDSTVVNGRTADGPLIRRRYASVYEIRGREIAVISSTVTSTEELGETSEED